MYKIVPNTELKLDENKTTDGRKDNTLKWVQDSITLPRPNQTAEVDVKVMETSTVLRWVK